MRAIDTRADLALSALVTTYELRNGEFTLSDDPARLDQDAIFAFLSGTYWAKSRRRDTMDRAIANSVCIGVYKDREQIAFARAITDRCTFAYLADVYVLEAYRGRRIGKWLVESLLNHPELKSMRRWMLLTEDAHELYRKCGFEVVMHPGQVMERLQPYPSARAVE